LATAILSRILIAPEFQRFYQVFENFFLIAQELISVREKDRGEKGRERPSCLGL
jgi:hypothetical protein